MGDEERRVTIEQVIERFRGFAPGEYPRTEAMLAELSRLRAIEAAARAWCATYAIRPLTPEESALMLAVGE